jgi:azurin
LSADDYEEISGATAVSNFRMHYKHPDAGHSASGNEKSVSKKMNGVVIRLAAVSGKMLFDKTTLTVPAGKDISLVFRNLDQMAHNVVIVLPASDEKVGNAADAMASLKDGYERNFVPDLPEVLFATPLVNGGETFQLNFKAPSKRGEYPFICSFPGHWRMMKGILKVE